MRFIRKQVKKAVEIPGEPIFVGDKKQDHTRIHVLAYNEDQVFEKEITDYAEIENLKKEFEVIWINIDGIHDLAEIKKCGERFQIHSLILEDIMHTGQNPKMQVADNSVFTIFKMLSLNETEFEVDSEQVSLYLKDQILITFQEKTGDVFDPVRDRIRQKKGRVRLKKADYLAYCLLDCLADNYAYIIEYFGSNIEDLEEQVLKDPKSEVLAQINGYQVELNLLRKIVRPTKDMLVKFNKNRSDLIQSETFVYLDDLLETIQRVFENIESFKTMLSDLLNIYSTHVNHKLNEIMKVLTIFSAIFIPLTFIAGIYGTNFKNLPELGFKYGYFVMLGAMFLLVLIMIYFFRKKRWL